MKALTGIIRDTAAYEVNTTYEPFSREPEYLEVNRLFIESLDLLDRARQGEQLEVLDLACGTCTLTGLLLNRLSSSDRSPAGGSWRLRITGIDLSLGSLGIAKEYLRHRLEDRRGVGGVAASVALASAEALPLPGESLHAVLIGNAIQLFKDKQRVMEEVGRVLKPGGLVAFNTSFYAGTYPPGTESFYVKWVEHSLACLKSIDSELRSRGLPGVSRRRLPGEPQYSRHWLSRDEYALLLTRNGFEIESATERSVLLTQHSFETIGAYAGLAEVLLRGYPSDIASEALQRAAGPAFDVTGVSAVPRRWLEIVARKKDTSGHGKS